jgi:hypothetical protein
MRLRRLPAALRKHQRGLLLVGKNIAYFGKPFSVLDLFKNSEQGYWYDSSDLSSMYQDDKGVTPATAPGQGLADCSVGMRLDKRLGLTPGSNLATTLNSAPGSWTYNAGVVTASGTAGASDFVEINLSQTIAVGESCIVTVPNTMPTSGFYVNLLSAADTTSSNQAGNLSASATQVIVTATAASTQLRVGRWAGSPSGTMGPFTVRKLPGNHATQPTAGSRPTLSARYNLLLATAALSTQSVTVLAASHVLSFTGTGTVTLSGTSTAGPLVGTGANNRVSLTFTPTAGSLTLTVTGSVTLADLRLADDTAKAIPAYQAVTSATTYDTAGFPWYLRYDGLDDGFATASVDFTWFDKIAVLAGVQKASDAASGALVELSATSSSNAGTFALLAPSSPTTDRLMWRSKGAAAADAITTSASYNAPVSAVLTGIGDISGDVSRLYVNSVLAAETLTDQGAGNLGNYAMYIGRRNNATLPFSGRDYGQIVRASTAVTTDAQRSNAQRYLARAMAVPS